MSVPPSDAAHAEFPPSSSERWTRCPFSVATPEPEVALTRRSWDPGPSELGTAAHLLFEQLLKYFLEPDAPYGELGDEAHRSYWLSATEQELVLFDFSGRATGPVGAAECREAVEEGTSVGAVECAALDLEGTYRAAEYVRDRVESWGAELLGVERRLVYLERRGSSCWGTSDAILYYAESCVLEVVDFKHGEIYVDARDNSQLKCYLLGGALLLERMGRPLKDCVATILQPNSFPPEHRSAGVTLGDLDGHRLLVGAAVQRVRRYQREGLTLREAHERGELEPGPHCTYCPVAGAPCPALKQYLAESASLDFDDEPFPHAWSLDLEELASVVRRAQLARRFVSACQGRARSLLMSGAEVPGLKLVRARGTRRLRQDLTDPEIEASFLAAGGRLEDLYSRVMRGVVELERALPPNRRSAFGALVFEEVPGRVWVELEEDPREAEAPYSGAASEFEGLVD